MSVGKIALGVFLGNLATALISLIIIAFWADGRDAQANVDAVSASYNQMLERQRIEGADANAS